ncbi:MAG: Glycosyl transferase, family 2 [uncultured Acetobacteraceae bacterium]|uniref:Glycosyl transferase, family 2 n=1 Tax=uncultured Acetobacteraceae bacterium TaxID=169975 RepID=A0A6J4JIT8_9PROT|nr:MAG: Glycosyl transferase, family 2 [uncultured Acetobacteraceae bacterium]
MAELQQMHPPPQGARPIDAAVSWQEALGHHAGGEHDNGGHAVGLSIVVPVYRGAATVGRLVEVLSALRPAGGLEIILVNDGSPDNSGEVCRALTAGATVPLTYLEHARNFGEHNAVMTGLRHARGAFVITMDDDLQNPPEEVLKLYDHARLGNWDVVYTRYAEKKHEGWRNIGSRFANRVADMLLDKPKGLYLSSFRCMSAMVVRGVTRYSGPYPYVDGLIMQVTQRIDSVEVLHLARMEGQSNYTVARLVRLWLNLATNFSVLPLRLAILAGAAMGVLGLLGAALVVAEAATGSTPSGWASVMTVILLLSGVQFLILGVMGEYVGRAFLSANGKPQGVVRQVIGPAAEEIGAAPAPRPGEVAAAAELRGDATPAAAAGRRVGALS